MHPLLDEMVQEDTLSVVTMKRFDRKRETAAHMFNASLTRVRVRMAIWWEFEVGCYFIRSAVIAVRM